MLEMTSRESYAHLHAFVAATRHSGWIGLTTYFRPVLESIGTSKIDKRFHI